MDIKVLGSGSSGNCYRVSDGKTSLLLDAGLPIKRIKQGLDFLLHDIDGVLITHEHLDHAKAVNDLVKCGIDVYMSAGTRSALKIEHHRAKTIKSMTVFTIGSFRISAFDLVHDAKEPTGFLMYSMTTQESLLYMTDTMYCKHRFKNLTYMLIEMNFDYNIARNNVMNRELNSGLAHRIYNNHMSKEAALEFIKINKSVFLKEIYLLHLSDGNSDAQAFKKAVQALTGVRVYVA